MTEFGLGPQEAHLYCHLISVKSATVPELMARKEFAKIQRPNLYKLITSLKEKNAILEEQKGEMQKDFPCRTCNLLSKLFGYGKAKN